MPPGCTSSSTCTSRPREAPRRPPVRSRCPTSDMRPPSGHRSPVRSRATRRSSSTCSTSRIPTATPTPRRRGSAFSTALPGERAKGFSYRAAGMQQLLDAVRATGATNVIMVGGPQYAGDLDHWLQYEPVDPRGPARGQHPRLLETPVAPRLFAVLQPRRVGAACSLPFRRECRSWWESSASSTAATRSIPRSWISPTTTASRTWAGPGSREVAPASPRSSPTTRGLPRAYGIGYKQHLASLGN